MAMHTWILWSFLFYFFVFFCLIQVATSFQVVLIKVGGSSITNKAVPETLDPTALAWFTNTIAQGYQQHATNEHNSTRFVLIHGAGSFGHFTAKEYGLSGQTEEPLVTNAASTCSDDNDTVQQLRFGVSRTRLSVQKLNRIIVDALVQQAQIPAVSVSPCFAVPGLQAHGGNTTVQDALQSVVYDTLQAGLVPVLHGDACLYGNNSFGILSGDTLMQLLGTAEWVTRAVFLTDVDGVYTADPRASGTAVRIPRIHVHEGTGELFAPGDDDQATVNASGSQHTHDVTGGFQTKLAAARVIAAAGKVVTIAQCTTPSAEQTILSPQLDESLSVTHLLPVQRRAVG